MAVGKPLKGIKRVVDNKMRAYGETDYSKNQIRVNKARHKKDGFKRINKTKAGKESLADTILHEESHLAFPKMSEKNIKKRTKTMINKMSVKQKNRLYSLYKKK